MRILMVASEALPWSKTGGLADVVGALPRALSRLGHHVDLVIPHYRAVEAPPGSASTVIEVEWAGERLRVPVATVDCGTHRAHLIRDDRSFDRAGLYGEGGVDYEDNPARFGLLSAAALALVDHLPEPIDVVHAHDWQTGLVPALIRTGRCPGRVRRTPTVFTIHNLAYQGVFDSDWLPRLGLGWDLMRVDTLEYWGRISYLKGGVLMSDVVTTVSPRYAREIQTSEFGFGFEGIIRSRADALVGILNGIDHDEWNPAADPHLDRPFDAAHLAAKRHTKRKVLDAYGLPTDRAGLERPLVGMISRMVDQKGLDIIAGALDRLVHLDASFVILGTGEPRYETMWRETAAAHPRTVGVKVGFDEALAHQIEGGSDMFLMPSRFEPCGLNQMYSLRYGTVPIVHAVGGLADTVADADDTSTVGTGFVLQDYSDRGLLDALGRALALYKDRHAWARLQRRGMACDFSWDASAREYVKVYERVLR